MKRAWIRLYTDLPDNPKVQKLSGDLFKFWVNLLCVFGRAPVEAGSVVGQGSVGLRSASDLAWIMRRPEADVAADLSTLVSAGLLERRGSSYYPHDWDKHQYSSDISTTRVKRFRNGQRNVSETRQSRTEQSRTDAETVQASDIGATAEVLRMDRPGARSLAAAALAAPQTELTDPGLAACALALELVPREHPQRRQCELVLMEAHERICKAEAPRKYAERIIQDILRRA